MLALTPFEQGCSSLRSLVYGVLLLAQSFDLQSDSNLRGPVHGWLCHHRFPFQVGGKTSRTDVTRCTRVPKDDTAQTGLELGFSHSLLVWLLVGPFAFQQ